MVLLNTIKGNKDFTLKIKLIVEQWKKKHRIENEKNVGNKIYFQMY